MRSNIKIDVEFLAGTDIESAIDEAKALAIKLGIAYVSFKFNGVEISVRQVTDVERAVEIYRADPKLEHLVV